MISKSDIPIVGVIKLLASHGIEAGYLVPTQTAMEKSICDAHSSLRDYFKKTNIHDYEKQGQGSENKVVLDVHLITDNSIIKTKMSLYRPPTKLGDPRIWIYGLNEYAVPFNLLAIFQSNNIIYIFNASNDKILKQPKNNKYQTPDLFSSLNEIQIDLAPTDNSPLNKILVNEEKSFDEIELELIDKLKKISKLGFVNSLRSGDTGVGMTLETLLGIRANSNRAPDFHGIEIKAKRGTGNNKKTSNRVNLYSQVPNWKKSECKTGMEILKKYGYVDSTSNRLQLYCTNSNVTNPQGLYLNVDEQSGILESLHKGQNNISKVVVWELDNLKKQLEIKHKKTFWVKANSIKNGLEEKFHYIEIEKTHSPLSSNLPTLIEIGAVTMDYTLSQKPVGNSARDHGYLFKIHPDNFDLLFPPTKIISLI